MREPSTLPRQAQTCRPIRRLLLGGIYGGRVHLLNLFDFLGDVLITRRSIFKLSARRLA
jgi:hypothetical protein